MSIDHRILIADDDRDFRHGVADLFALLPRRFEIVQAETGLEALDLMRLQIFDLALLDMHMPGRTGLEVLSVLRLETRAVPCIFISGDANDSVRDQAIQEGALSVLKKPLRPELLRAEVRRLLGIEAA